MAAAEGTDVVIIGGGISGLVTALELVRAGRRVTVLEGDGRDRFGGQARDAFGGWFFVDSPEQRRARVKDSPEMAWEDWRSYAEYGPGSETQQHWGKKYVERCVPDVRAFLENLGLSFFPTANWAERAHAGKGNRVPRFHIMWGCGPAVVSGVRQAIEPFEGGRLDLRFEHRVEEILSEGGRVVGVRGTDDTGNDFEVRADATVIASGGFTGNIDKIREHWPTDVWHQVPEDLLIGVWETSDGAMHDRAVELGAALTNMENMWVYVAGVTNWAGDHDRHGLSLIPMKSALWMRGDGRRFDPPLLAGYDTRDAVSRVMQSGYTHSWAVLNRAILAKELAIQGATYNPNFRTRNLPGIAKDILLGQTKIPQSLVDRCPDVVTASSLEELARRMESVTPGVRIDTAGMAQDVRSYDAEIKASSSLYTDDQLVSLRAVRAFPADKMRTKAFHPIEDGKGELVAIRMRPNVRKSLGGIHTDESCAVLDTAGRPIEGLHAVGESTGFGGGGMHGKRTLEGTLLGGCILTARTLAAHLAH